MNQLRKRKGEVEERKQTFSDGFDIGAGSTSGVDGFLVALGGGVRGSLSDHHRLPILRHRSNSCHMISSSSSLTKSRVSSPANIR